MFVNYMLYQIIIAILILIVLILFIFKAIGIASLAKRRNINNYWFAFIPIMQDYMLGKVLDNINSFKYRKTNYCFGLFIMNCYIVPVSILAMFTEMPQILYSLNGIVSLLYRILLMVVCFKIYKDYSPKNWFLLGLLSIFFHMEEILLLTIRKKVPVSMCFNEDDEWLFESNQPQLKMLWKNYHSYKPTQTFGEYLIMVGFYPNAGMNPMMPNMMMGYNTNFYNYPQNSYYNTSSHFNCETSQQTNENNNNNNNNNTP